MSELNIKKTRNYSDELRIFSSIFESIYLYLFNTIEIDKSLKEKI